MMELPRNEESFRQHFTEEMGTISWKELERFFAAGAIIEVCQTLSLIDAAVAIAMDDTSLVENWLATGQLKKLPDESAIRLHESNAKVTAIISRPWILIQI